MAVTAMFNPFAGKRPTELSAQDLAALANIPEGWFVEYKREPCRPRDYAKEASAFANAHGGWLIIGLDEDAASKTPLGGPGIDIATKARAVDGARDAILQNLSPSPRIELAFVDGPIDALGVPPQRGVIVIFIPKSTHTPHVHSSGKIYRRQVDSADPAHVHDRAELDRLYDRRARRNQLIDEELDIGFDDRWAKDFAFPWIHLAFVPEHPRREDSSRVTIEGFRSAILGSPQGEARIRLPDVQASSLGYLANNMSEQAQPGKTAISLEYSHTGGIYATIPLSFASLSTSDEIAFLSNSQGKRFRRLLQKRGLDGNPILDGTHLGLALSGLSGHVSSLISEFGGGGRYYGRVKVRNTFRCVSFFDSKLYVDWCEAHCPPVVSRDNFDFPWSSQNWLVVDDFEDDGVIRSTFHCLLPALGVGDDVAKTVASETVETLLTISMAKQLQEDDEDW